jgi:hypothetical protein
MLSANLSLLLLCQMSSMIIPLVDLMLTALLIAALIYMLSYLFREHVYTWGNCFFNLPPIAVNRNYIIPDYLHPQPHFHGRFQPQPHFHGRFEPQPHFDGRFEPQPHFHRR